MRCSLARGLGIAFVALLAYFSASTTLLTVYGHYPDTTLKAFYKHMWRYGTASAITKNKVRWSNAVLRHIDIPINRTWGGNYVTILSALFATRGPILELGVCPVVSPLIHNMATEFGRQVFTVESEPEVLKQFLVLQNAGHKFAFVSDKPFPAERYLPSPAQLTTWSGVGSESRWGLVVVSCSPTDFGMDDIWELRDRTSVFVVADPEEHLFDKERREVLHHQVPHGFIFKDPELGLHETVVWSMDDSYVVRQIRKLSCWTGEILGEKMARLDETEC